MAYQFQRDNATIEVTPKNDTLVTNEVNGNLTKYAYNSSVDYCSFVRENNLEGPVKEYLVQRIE